MAINLNLYPYFFEEPKIDALWQKVPNVPLGVIRAIYIQCLHVMHQGIVDYLNSKKLTLIIYENMHNFGENARSMQRTCSEIATNMNLVGLCHSTFDESLNAEILRFPAMTKKLPKLEEIKETNKLRAIKAAKARWERDATEHATKHNSSMHQACSGDAISLSLSLSKSKEEESVPLTSPSPSKPKRKPKQSNQEVTTEMSQIIERWNSHTDWKSCVRLEGKRLQKFSKRFNEMPNVSDWIRIIDMAAAMPWPTGQVPSRDDRPPFRASFDWLLEDGQFTRIEEETVPQTTTRFY